MRLLIVLTVSATLAFAEALSWIAPIYEYRGPPAPLADDGRVIDTPDVARARAAHLAAHAETLARLRQAQSDYEKGAMTRARAPMQTREYQRSFAPLGPDGRVVDTPEVAQAKAAHMAAHARAAAKATPQYEPDVYDGRANLIYLAPLRLAYTSPVGYRGPPAPLGPDGRVVDTPEVVRAREAHMKAHAHAMSTTTHRERTYY